MLFPRRFTPPLAESFPSQADRWLPVVQAVWRQAFGFVLDDWQLWLLRSVFEVFPPGHEKAGQLRFRQAIVSCPRQNGKSTLTAALAMIGLLRAPDSLVVSLASSVDQSRIIFTQVLRAVNRTPELKAMFRAVDTETRGIRGDNGSSYMVRPAKSAALQGLAVSLGICDELHLLETHSWTDLVSGTGARPNALVFGVSTAGTDQSGLLQHLYVLGEAAIPDPDTRVGFWVWETEDEHIPDDDGELLAKLRTSNPAMHSGRMDDDAVLADVRSLPPSDIVQYRFNRFTSSTDSFVPLSAWNLCRADAPEIPPRGVVLAVDRSPGWEYATVTASWRVEGRTWTEVVASVTHPTPAMLVELAAELAARFAPRAVVVDGYGLRAVAAELKLRGVPVTTATLADVAAASALFYANVVQRKLTHPGDPLLSVQLPGCRRKNVQGSEAFRVTRASGAMSIDSVMSTILGCYFAETLPDNAPQLFA